MKRHSLRPAGPHGRRCAPLAAFLWLVVLPAAAAEVPVPVRQMLDNAPERAEERCSYTRIKIDDDVRQERFVAGGEEPPWRLLQVDGREPTEAELRHYARGQNGRDRRHPLAFDLREMVDPEHWRLRESSAGEAVYEFRLRPNEDLDESLVDKVLGTLVVDTERDEPVRIVIENTEPAYVAPFVRVAEYRQEMEFEWQESVGAAVLASTETTTNGRALGLKPLRRHKLVRYTDYACSGLPPVDVETAAEATAAALPPPEPPPEPAPESPSE